MLDDDTIQYFDNGIDTINYFDSIFDMHQSEKGKRQYCTDCQYFNRCVVNHVTRKFEDVSECDMYRVFEQYTKPINADPFADKSWVWHIP